MDRRLAFRHLAAGLIVVAAGALLWACADSTPSTSSARGSSDGSQPGASIPAGAFVGATTSTGGEPVDPTDAPTTAPAPSAETVTPAPSPTPAPSATPAPSPALDPPPAPGPFSMDLYRKGDFVTEKTPIWCAPAALQTMINIMSPGADTTRKTQKLLNAIARKLGPAPDKGSEPEGEAKALKSLGYGSYRVIVTRTRSEAFKAAARAIRLTGKPVALLVWRGAHNWVISGFRATADPALGGDFRVTHLRIEDVWYPRISSIWGESRPPDALVPVRLMPEDYLPWRRPTGRYPGKDGRFVLIVPGVAR